MRVLFINRMASMVRGGGETFDLEISKHLEKLGCEVTFLSGIPLFSGAKTSLMRRKSTTIRTPYFGWFPWDSVKGGWRVRLADFWMFEKKAAAWAAKRQDEFDVIQVCELPTFVSEWKRKKCKVPVVMRLTAPDYHDPTGALQKADALIASGATLQSVQKNVRSDCVDISNGVDVDVFRPHATTWRQRHGISADAFVVLFVARFQRVKNHRMLLQAFSGFIKKCPSACLVLAGSGPLEDEMKAQSKNLGIENKTHFLGETPFEGLPDIYAAADMKVISSDYESFCFAALEAMATGLPLVVTDTDWVPNLIGRDKGGIVVPIGDAEAMMRGMMWIHEHAEERQRMGLWNRAQVETNFTWTNSAKKLKAVYEQRMIRAT